jgi:hypothetical protein
MVRGEIPRRCPWRTGQHETPASRSIFRVLLDEPRLLHRRPEVGYTNRTAEAMNGEPEAVSRQEQARQTEVAHVHARVENRQRWLLLRGRLEPVLGELHASFGPRVSNELRSIRREVARLDAKLR